MTGATQAFWQISYIVAALCVVLAIKWLSSPATARRGVFAGELGMLLAIIGTLLRVGAVNIQWILIAMVVGAAIGAPLAYLMPMTSVPQLTALSHAFGALAAALVGTAEFYKDLAEGHPTVGFKMFAIVIESLLGYLTVTASVMAFGKLQELIPTRPMTYKGQNFINLILFAIAAALGVWMIVTPAPVWVFPSFIALSALFGILLILPIGGGDMPTVIALLNSYAGAACAAMGFALENYVLIIAGAVNAASGFILSVIMCNAMNRSFTNVLFGAFGQAQTGTTAAVAARPVRSATPEDAASILAGARRVIVVPGYGMAVAQAQHKLRELSDMLTKRGVQVDFAIHPVAGRMPGHMNVLLAEANVPYSQLYEMQQINPEFPSTDVAVVIGANDVVNPDARDNPKSLIAGMPILEVDRAKSVIVLKRGQGRGFSGLENPLFFKPCTSMLYGDAKSTLGKLAQAVQHV